MHLIFVLLKMFRLLLFGLAVHLHLLFRNSFDKVFIACLSYLFIFPEKLSTASSQAILAEAFSIFVTDFENSCDIFLLEFSDICLNISGIGSYVNLILDLNMFNAFFISSSS